MWMGGFWRQLVVRHPNVENLYFSRIIFFIFNIYECMTDGKATIHHIAKELNITASTVSRALNDHPKISQKTKKRVLEKAREMNYQPNNIAVALRSGRSNTVGVIVPVVNRNFFSSVIRGIEDVVNQSGYNVIICQTYDQMETEIKNLRSLKKLRVDGILVSYAKETTSFGHYEEMIKEGYPLIFFDRTDDSLDIGSVVIDDYLGSFRSCEHLIQQGFKRIAHFCGPQNVSIYRERKRGYLEALRKHGLPVNEAWIIDSELKYESGTQHAREILAMKERPDAIFSASDLSAMGAMIALKESGLSIPADMGFVGFSNEPFTSFVEPGLTSVEQHPLKMGQLAARIFLDQIESRDQSYTPTKMILKPELIIRGSSVRG